MPKYYSEYDRSSWLYQPNFARVRHQFRGPRHSNRINQFRDQFTYDRQKLQRLILQTNRNLRAFRDEMDYNWNQFIVYMNALEKRASYLEELE